MEILDNVKDEKHVDSKNMLEKALQHGSVLINFKIIRKKNFFFVHRN